MQGRLYFAAVAGQEITLMTLHSVQVETIGDAYCVAGGLHKESDTHALQIALMALKMMELSDEVMTPTGEPIQVGLEPSPHYLLSLEFDRQQSEWCN